MVTVTHVRVVLRQSESSLKCVPLVLIDGLKGAPLYISFCSVLQQTGNQNVKVWLYMLNDFIRNANGTSTICASGSTSFPRKLVSELEPHEA